MFMVFASLKGIQLFAHFVLVLICQTSPIQQLILPKLAPLFKIAMFCMG